MDFYIIDSDLSVEIEYTSPEVCEAAKNNFVNLLPLKSTYIEELSQKLKPSSLWTQYSMLQSTLCVHHDVVITKYLKSRALLKRYSDGYKSKKSKTLTSEKLNRFIREASDDKYFFTKGKLIELQQLTINDIENLRSAALIKIPNSKTKKPRSFTAKLSNIFQ
ncbi:hypothetical protein RN001_006488 [Aquatica leii]|uniref:Uncharacterized protein n=1 Tax=Aquatica leii TaxID=1421715 RepID=A0AAN7SJV3_9COLE|nr:hypothetical protein RN001_006488 [Aquatica leii]